MGTTMHAHIEVKLDGNWEHYATPTIEQNYLLYAAVNGVRNDFSIENLPEIKPQASIHGLPTDCTKLTKYCHELDNKAAHIYGEGCLTATDLENLQQHLFELADAIDFTERYSLDLDDRLFKTYINGNSIMEHQGFEDVRIIFWYDN